MNIEKRIVIVGATSAIAEHCARLWLAKQAVDLTLVGRDAGRLDRVAKDLKVRSPESNIRVVETKFFDVAAINGAVDSIVATGGVDIVLIAHGSLPDQADCQDDLGSCREALEINAISPVLFAEAFAKHMAKINRGVIALIGSVAGDRGRKSNYVYGAAKGLVTRYAQGLQHRFAGSGVSVVLVKPGPTDTPMTARIKAQGGKLATVEDVSMTIVTAIDRKRETVYAPGKWAIIMQVIRHLPSFIFKKLDI